MSNMKENWEKEATSPDVYHAVECKRGREFILRLTTGADVYLALQKFAIDHEIRFAKIHAAFMGGLEPTKFLMWAPDTSKPSNWHNESTATIQNLSMILSMSGIIHPRIMKGEEEPFPAIHFVTGGAWNVPSIGGHLVEGTIVKGVLEIFITEVLGIDVLLPSNYDPTSDVAPESWYKEA